MSRTIECTHCGQDVVLNGIGSSRNALQRALTATLQFVLPLTSKQFLEPSEWHDYAVHKGPPMGEEFEKWHVRVDKIFRDKCLVSARQSCWTFMPAHYKKQALGLYEALEFNYGSGYPEKQCNH